MPSLTKLRLLNPGKKMIRTVENLGLRLGMDKIPLTLKRQGVTAPIRHGRGVLEPYWHKATLPHPPIGFIDLPYKDTKIGRFMVKEWERLKRSEKYNDHQVNRIPEGQIRNPFLPWFNPITRRWDSPVYNLRQQRLLVKEARRLNLTDVLPSGPKTPPEFANTFLDAWREMGVERKRTELGRIIWAGVYKKKLNPFGQARFVEGKMDEEKRKAREVVEGLERWGPYSGRIAMFKGTLAQRRAPAREAEIKARMDGMAKRVEAWKKEKKAEKEKARPTLPF